MSLYLTDLQVEADVYVIYSPCELDILDAIDISEDTADWKIKELISGVICFLWADLWL